MYSMFVESLKRLYMAGRITHEKLDDLLARDKITQEEYDYITAQ